MSYEIHGKNGAYWSCHQLDWAYYLDLAVSCGWKPAGALFKCDEGGYSQVEAGFLITPWPVTLAVMTLIAAPLGDRVQSGLLGGAGLFVVAVGLISMATLSGSPSSIDLAWRLILGGLGFGFFQTPNMKAMMSKRAGKPEWRRERHPSGFAAVRSVTRRGNRCDLPLDVGGAWYLGGYLDWRCHWYAWQHLQFFTTSACHQAAGVAAE